MDKNLIVPRVRGGYKKVIKWLQLQDLYNFHTFFGYFLGFVTTFVTFADFYDTWASKGKWIVVTKLFFCNRVCNLKKVGLPVLQNRLSHLLKVQNHNFCMENLDSFY